MKPFKRIRTLVMCALFLFCVLALSACGEDTPDSPTEATLSYQVTVVDGLGQPYTEKVIVKFMQDGTQVAMSNVDSNGNAKKELPAGDYTLEIATTESGRTCWFDQKLAVLTAENTQVQVTMAYVASGEAAALTATVPGTETSKEYQAYPVGTGSVYVPLTPGDRTYVIFTPTEGGVYQFATIGGADLGYYGAPHFVQTNNLAEVVDHSFSISVSDSSISTEQTGTARFVIGLDAEDGTEGTILNITRTGDKEWSIEDEPWRTYQARREITPYTLPEGVTLKSFELSAPTVAYKLVLNETDRCYHLNSADGKPVFVQLEKACCGISLKTMVGEIIYQDGVLMQSGTAPFRYMYFNSRDDFFKEDYTDVLRQYVTQRDASSGVYPLTEDLYYILSKGIEFMGWCNPESNNYLFAQMPNVNPELTWLFLFEFVDDGQIVLPLPDTNPDYIDPGYTDPGYTDPGTSTNPGTDNVTIPSNPIQDNKNSPEEIGGQLEFTAQVQPGHLYYYKLYKVSDTTLTIRSSNAYVIYKGKTYKPVNGVVTVPNLYSASTNLPVQLAIGNLGSSQESFYVTMSYPVGHRMNPYQLNPGSVSTYSAAGNSQGVFYSYTASKAGTLTIRLDSVSGGNEANITITSVKVDGGTRSVSLLEKADKNDRTVSFQLASGEGVIVCIGVMPPSGDNYPEATINSTVSFS